MPGTTRRRRVPAKGVTSPDRTAEHIRHLIFDGELAPGDRVPQSEIAEALGVSRIPVREALIALEAEGVVTIQTHRGAFVNPVDEESVRDHFELYGLVYGYASRKATEHSTPAMIKDLAETQKAMAAAKDVDEFRELAYAFNGVLTTFGSSPRMRAILSVLSGIVPGNFFSEIPGSVEVQIRGTAGILKAIKKGEPDRAAEECLKMMRSQSVVVCKELARRGLFN